MTLDEQSKRKNEKMGLDKAFSDNQDKLLEELRAEIAQKQLDNDALVQGLDAARLKNKQCLQKQRDMNQLNVALKSKLSFIMETYDYKDRVEGIETEVFSKVKKMNEQVNTTVDAFINKMEETKVETRTFLAERAAMIQMAEMQM